MLWHRSKMGVPITNHRVGTMGIPWPKCLLLRGVFRISPDLLCLKQLITAKHWGMHNLDPFMVSFQETTKWWRLTLVRSSRYMVKKDKRQLETYLVCTDLKQSGETFFLDCRSNRETFQYLSFARKKFFLKLRANNSIDTLECSWRVSILLAALFTSNKESHRMSLKVWVLLTKWKEQMATVFMRKSKSVTGKRDWGLWGERRVNNWRREIIVGYAQRLKTYRPLDKKKKLTASYCFEWLDHKWIVGMRFCAFL